MSLLDQIAGQAASALGGNASQGAMGEISELVGAQGVDGLVEKFKANGLGDVASSWVGTGSPQVTSIAQSLGVSPAEASKLIATYLPQVIDKLTPEVLTRIGAIVDTHAG